MGFLYLKCDIISLTRSKRKGTDQRCFHINHTKDAVVWRRSYKAKLSRRSNSLIQKWVMPMPCFAPKTPKFPFTRARPSHCSGERVHFDKNVKNIHGDGCPRLCGAKSLKSYLLGFFFLFFFLISTLNLKFWSLKKKLSDIIYFYFILLPNK